MADKKDLPEEREPQFIAAGPVNSAGFIYKAAPSTYRKNNDKNMYNTDIARERGIVKESEDIK